MNLDPKSNDYPQLVPPDVVYEHKDALKKNATVIPLFVKIASAAAAVALLVGLFWRPWATPRLDLMAEMKPLEMRSIPTETSLLTTGQRAHFVMPKTKSAAREKTSASVQSPTARPKSPTARPELPTARQELPMLASLSPNAPTLLTSYYAEPVVDPTSAIEMPQLAETPMQQWTWGEDLSLEQRGMLIMTDGKYDSFGRMLLGSWRALKTELAQLDESFSDGVNAVKEIDLSDLKR